MPRRNNRATPPTTGKKALDHWMQMCRKLTEQGQRTLIHKKGQVDRVKLTSKKDGKEVKKK